ncbi:MAG TPA: Ig-like domain-containing protein [Gemmatimonadaceae bacterium]|nr:Ig-like domain-containing protein [Gemmatimonadaceae bacterium]
MKATLGLAALIAMIAAAACGGADGGTTVTSAPPPPQGPSIGSVTIDQQPGLGKFKLDVGEQTGLTATVKDASGAVLTGQTVTWTSSAPSVATVSSTGTITGVASGDATISATVNGKSDTRAVQVLALNLTAFQLTVLVTDDSGSAMTGVSVEEVYYGARPSDCPSCNIPYGNVVEGTTGNTGSYVGHFVADPDGLDGFADMNHVFAYVVTRQANYETNRRWVVGTSASFTQPMQLHRIKQLTAGDSLAFAIADTDPVYQELDTSPAEFGNIWCRSFLVNATADGTLSLNVVPTIPGDGPWVELDRADESDLITFGRTGTVSMPVHAGDVVEVRIAATIKPGGPPQSFVLHTAVAR